MLGLILTLLKPVHAFLVIHFFSTGHNYLSSLTLLYLMVVDMFDGYLFSKSTLNNRKKIKLFRRIYNTTMDYASVQSVLVIMILNLGFPIEFYLVEVIREFALLYVWITGYLKNQTMSLGANLPARISIFCVGLMAISWLVRPIITGWALIPIIIFGIIGIRKHYLTAKQKA